MFIDLVSEVKLLNNHGVNNYRKPADQRAIHCLKSSSQERKGWRMGSVFRHRSCWEQTVMEEKGSSGEGNKKFFFFLVGSAQYSSLFSTKIKSSVVSSVSSGLICLIYLQFKYFLFWYQESWCQTIKWINAKRVLPMEEWSSVVLYKGRASVSHLSRFTYPQTCTFFSSIYGWKGLRKETVLNQRIC